jgi:hypothetical protein
MEEQIKKCGNCSHLMGKKGTIAEKTWQEELNSGICECNGKSMSGSLIAGCPLHKFRKQNEMVGK